MLKRIVFWDLIKTYSSESLLLSVATGYFGQPTHRISEPKYKIRVPQHVIHGKKCGVRQSTQTKTIGVRMPESFKIKKDKSGIITKKTEWKL
ncbi:MAG: hypothetical protein K9H64_02260 [Bacteroidales bacterium]|nr:hypothetical protein [Bacteroidales bacterium]MCF8454629.1 hypothetical protein [Bacteroidales bacterium]